MNERRLEEVIAEYLDLLNQGEPLDPIRILAEDPEHGPDVIDALREFIDLESNPTIPLGTLGDYTLRRQIGRGGMGVVYEAWQGSMDRVVALKVLPPGVAADTRACARFMREAQAAGKLSHQNVVSVHSTGVEEGTPWYSMEYVEGETLAQVLAKIKDADEETETLFGPKGSIDYFGKLARAFADVSGGLQHAHSKGVTHRDIKPSNLILDAEGRLRILDFGLAQLEGQDSLTNSGDVVGTPLYMSPEQARRKKIDVDHRTDIYSLGSTMYEALCGRPPFRGKDHADTLSQIIERDPVELRKINLRVPKDFETIVLKCLRKDAGDRYGTAEALGQDLRRFVRGDPIEALRTSGWDRVLRRLRRQRNVLFGCLVFGGLLAGFLWLAGRVDDAVERADHEAQGRALAEYEPRIHELAGVIAAGRFSLQGSPVARAQSVRFVKGWLSGLEESEVDSLLRERARRSITAAARELRSITKKVPDGRDGHFYLARAYRLLGEIDESRAAANACLAVDPLFVPARVLIEDLDRVVERRVRTEARDSREHDSDDWTGPWREGHDVLAESKPHWPDAHAAFDEVLRRMSAPDATTAPYSGLRFEALLGRAAAAIGLDRFDEAIEDLSAASALVPSSMEPALLIGKAYLLGTGRDTQAGRVFERLRSREPTSENDATVLWILKVYMSLRDFEGALDWTDHLVDAARRARLRAYLHVRRRDWEKAATAAREAVALSPSTVSAHVLLVSALLGRTRIESTPSCESLLELLRAAQRATEFAPASRLAAYSFRMAAARARPFLLAQKEKPMKNTTNPCRLLAALWLTLSVSVPAPAEEIMDVFAKNPDIFAEGREPLRWENGCFSVIRAEVTTDGNGICLTRTNPDYNAVVGTQDVFAGDVTLRVQTSTHIQIFIHLDPCSFSGYGFFTWGRDPERWALSKWTNTSDVNIANGAAVPALLDGQMIYELRTVGPRIEVRAWPAEGGVRPSEPGLSVEDETYREGVVAIGTLSRTACYSWASIESGEIPDPPERGFVRGDSNDDGEVDLSDAVHSLNWLFLGGPAPGCLASANTNGDTSADISDATYLLNHLFLGGPAPVAPYPNCGAGTLPADEKLGCETPPKNCSQ